MMIVIIIIIIMSSSSSSSSSCQYCQRSSRRRPAAMRAWPWRGMMSSGCLGVGGALRTNLGYLSP